MFGNKIVISREQYDTVKGVVQISGSNEYDVCYGVIELGLALLLALTFDKASGTNEKAQQSIDACRTEPETKNMSDALMKYIGVEDKFEHIGDRDFFSLIGIHTINVAPEQKDTVKNLSRLTGFSERAISFIVFESGVTFMMLISKSSPDEVKDVLWEWMKDDDIMKVANGLRASWEASNGVNEDNHKYFGGRGKIIYGKDLSEDTYFIRRKADGFYLHFAGEFDKDNVAFIFKSDIIGACAWHKKEGATLITKQGLTDVVELVHHKDVIK